MKTMLGPDVIYNEKLYKVCGTFALEDHIRKMRRSLSGHILRLPDDIPANKAMMAYFDSGEKGRRGRPTTCLPSVLDSDLKSAGLSPRSKADVLRLRLLAQNRSWWIKMFEDDI